jgi:hypothetical protein
LSSVLKNSLHTVWGYMKRIDVKESFGNASLGDNGVIGNNKDKSHSDMKVDNKSEEIKGLAKNK